ncbi:hypothetical protein HZ996_05900 [Cryomorphaceae bacterium]|nr:hypothetical protein HZ996_05900 [Cryomorphaceae bacterium]
MTDLLQINNLSVGHQTPAQKSHAHGEQRAFRIIKRCSNSVLVSVETIIKCSLRKTPGIIAVG